MNYDYRVKIGAFQNIKIKRLIARHGTEAFIGVLKLWEYAATKESEDGLLCTSESGDVAMIADIADEDFGNNLASLGLLDFDEKTGFRIHNWRRHNSWCCGSKSRNESAKIAGKASAKARGKKS